MDKFNLFGRSYESVGKESADFCIKTKGKVKIKWGSKYLDLIKDGKLNVEADFIFSVKDEEHIGSKDGIYLTEDGVVFIKVGDNIIPIYGDTQGSDFVAYILQEGKTGDEKTIAQKNIGIQFDSLASAQSSGIKNGIVFIVEENALYKVKDGVYEKFEFKMPNPITEPLIIKVAGGQYALLIDGYFSSSGAQLVIGSVDNGIRIYSESDEKFIDVPDILNIAINGNPVFSFENGKVASKTDLYIEKGKSFISDTVKSYEGNEGSGYLLTMKNNESWLYVDNLVVRKGIDDSVHLTFQELVDLSDNENLTVGARYTIDDFQNEWDMVEERNEDEEEYDENVEDGPMTGIKFKNVFPMTVTAISVSEISQDVILTDYPHWKVKYDFHYRENLYTSNDDGETTTETAKGRIIWLEDEFGNKANYDFKHLRFMVDGKLQFTYHGADIESTGVASDGSLTGKWKNNTIICDIDNLARRSVDNDENINYILGNPDNIVVIENPITDNTIGTANGPIKISTEKCKGNEIEINSINNLEFKKGSLVENNKISGELAEKILINETGMITDNDILFDSLKSFELSGAFVKNKIDCNVITMIKIPTDGSVSDSSFVGKSIINLIVNKEISISYLLFNTLDFTGDGMVKCVSNSSLIKNTFFGIIKNVTFHSEISNRSFDIDTYPFFYSDKIVDVYINEDELRHICMPDTIFPGMIVMYDGRNPIPTGWVLCDGNNGTLNLLDRFAKFSDTAGNNGGSNTGMIEVKHLPTTYIKTTTNGAHNHTYTVPVQGISDNANDRSVMEKSATGTTSTAGNHTHDIRLNPGVQEKFEPPFTTVIPIMYIGG